jgi:hypothetical protein
LCRGPKIPFERFGLSPYRPGPEAKDAAAQLREVYPGFTVQTWAGMHWSEDPTFAPRSFCLSGSIAVGPERGHGESYSDVILRPVEIEA